MAKRHDPREWQERCQCGEVHDTYNGPSFPLYGCAERECHSKICLVCHNKCDDCCEYFCEHCVVTFEAAGKEHTMCLKCIVIAADEAEKEEVAA